VSLVELPYGHVNRLLVDTLPTESLEDTTGTKERREDTGSFFLTIGNPFDKDLRIRKEDVGSAKSPPHGAWCEIIPEGEDAPHEGVIEAGEPVMPREIKKQKPTTHVDMWFATRSKNVKFV
jgi:hypothetical protein